MTMTRKPTKRTPLERLILRGLMADQEAAIERRAGVSTWRVFDHFENAAAGLVPLNPSRWLGVHRLTPAQAQACCRAYRRLERAGVVELIRAWGGRVTALKRIKR